MSESILMRRKAKKRGLKYAEALKALKAYQNNKLRLLRVIDNGLNPNKSISKHCQVVGCGKAIRYEYILESKETLDILAVGSTCVWELLEMSKEQIKDFNKIEQTIKDFHKMIEWKRENPDVYDKIMEMKRRNYTAYQEFWIEIQYCALCQIDTDYIRKVDLEDVEKKLQAKKAKLEEAKRLREARLQNTVVYNQGVNLYVKNRKEITGEEDVAYERVLNKLDELVVKVTDSGFFKGLKLQAQKRPLTENQIYYIKVEANKRYFKEFVEPCVAKLRIFNDCEVSVYESFKKLIEDGTLKLFSVDKDAVVSGKINPKIVNKYREQFNKVMLNEINWSMFRLKYNVFVR